LISRGAKGGVALLVAGSVTGLLAGTASADAISDSDLAYARLLTAAELLAADFYTQAIASNQLSGDAQKYLKRALFNEQEHYTSMSGILSGAGQPPAVAEDFDFLYPKGTFASTGAIVKLGMSLETTVLGAYLGAVAGLQANALKQPVARIAASEAQHLSVFSRLAGHDPVGNSFPDALTIDEASSAFDPFTS
jgi:rubrerythrin